MGKSHLSRLAASNSLSIKRKATKWITRPVPGPHPLNSCVTINTLLKNMLEYARTSKEVRMILNQKNILIDKKVRTECKFPVGFMDVIEVPLLNEYYRLVYDNRGRFSLIAIKKDQSNFKLLKIVRKNLVKGGKMQLTFHDGRTILTDKFDGRVGDSILFDIMKKSISKLLPLTKDCLVYISGGSHTGSLGRLKEIIREKNLQNPKVVVDVSGKDYITFAKYAFVVGKNKPELDLEAKR